MSIISYSQNFEDVILWRALKHVKNGFYIDVGANDPTVYSITKAFYDTYWQGINIEPSTHYFEKLKLERRRDTNINCIIGSSKKLITFYEFENTGLSTINNDIANEHIKKGYRAKTLLKEMKTLNEICNILNTKTIHFLKIDVEGAEKEVLEGFDLTRFRPWIILVESTIPGSTLDSSSSWEDLIISNNYSQVYFDGINKFYLSNENENLAGHFSQPPNVHDRFTLSDNHDLITNSRFKKTLEKENERLQNRISAIEATVSWRITAPLRRAKGLAMHLRPVPSLVNYRSEQLVKLVFSNTVKLLLRFLQSDPRLFRVAERVLRAMPSVRARAAVVARRSQRGLNVFGTDDAPTTNNMVSEKDSSGFAEGLYKALLEQDKIVRGESSTITHEKLK